MWRVRVEVLIKFRVQKMWEISLPTEEVLSSDVRLCSIDLAKRALVVLLAD
jgi:hypothetical protein